MEALEPVVLAGVLTRMVFSVPLRKRPVDFSCKHRGNLLRGRFGPQFLLAAFGDRHFSGLCEILRLDGLNRDEIAPLCLAVVDCVGTTTPEGLDRLLRGTNAVFQGQLCTQLG